VLFRTNAQSAAYETALADAGVPYVVRGVERFFERPEIREAMVMLRGAARAVEPDQPLVEAVTETLSAVGFRPADPPSGGSAREKWEALAAVVRLAEDFVAAHPDAHLPAFTDELAERAAVQHAPTVDGVTLASLHAAKGLEWDAVFLVGLAEGTMPITFAKTPAQLEEERRLLYVGITRAREHLWLSWALSRSPGGRGGRRPCRFLPSVADSGPSGRSAGARSGPSRSGPKSLPLCRICGVALFDPTQRKLRRCGGCPADYDEDLFGRLREWRTLLAKQQKLPAYVIFTDATLTAVAEQTPSTEQQLAAIPGVGPRKLTLYADAILALVAGADPLGLAPAEPESAEPESAEPESAEPESAEPESAEPESAEPESAEPESAGPEPADPVPADE
jgi:DNA helicase-2/ATP-dependent DNA helicase PcrA